MHIHSLNVLVVKMQRAYSVHGCDVLVGVGYGPVSRRTLFLVAWSDEETADRPACVVSVPARTTAYTTRWHYFVSLDAHTTLHRIRCHHTSYETPEKFRTHDNVRKNTRSFSGDKTRDKAWAGGRGWESDAIAVPVEAEAVVVPRNAAQFVNST